MSKIPELNPPPPPLRARTARIGTCSQAGVGLMLAGVLAVMAVAFAFGADEQQNQAPLGDRPPVMQSGAAEVPEWIKGWNVMRIVIPSSGNIEHAFVDLQTAAGRKVTLTAGVLSKEGVTLEKVEWSGSPVRAKVILRKDQGRAELFADANAVSRNDDLHRRVPQVEIEAKFIEMPDAMAKEMPILNPQAVETGISRSKPSFGGLAGVISGAQFEQLVRGLNQKKGVDLVSAPRVTSKSQQRAVIEIVREFRYPTEWDPPDARSKHWTPKTFETKNTGLTIEVEATINEDDTIDLNVSPQMVEFLGFIDYETKQPLAKTKHGSATPLMERTLDPGANTGAKLSDRTQPVFQTRKNTTSLTIYSGQSVILILGETEPTRVFTSPSAGRTMVAIVTARRMNPDEPPRDTGKSSAEPAAIDRLLFGAAPSASPQETRVPAATAVEGKKGFVRSPYAPEAGYIDVRGFPGGTEVKCPYSGKIFRVPDID